jgi:monofunctional glycosyltransferase
MAMNPEDEDPPPSEPPQPYTPTPRPRVERPAPASAPSPEPQPAPPAPPTAPPDIALPSAGRVGGVRARNAQHNLDLDLRRMKRRKRYGFAIIAASSLFLALVVAPVTWVAAYLFIDPPTNILMMLRAGEGQTIRHQPVALGAISPHLIRAVIAAEDNNFCSHSGFDIEAIEDAMQANARGGNTRGASSISQQVAKNLFLWPDRSWLRKGLETYFTALIEFMWPKRRIMEHYLNIAEWNDGNFGAEAAAQALFQVSAADLSPRQAAQLAAVLPSPYCGQAGDPKPCWRANRPGPYVRERAATLVRRAGVVRTEHLAGCVLDQDAAPNPK